jgi:hypothetical protein
VSLRHPKLYLVVLAAFAAIGVAQASAVGRGPVVVFNNGNNPGSCGVGGFGGDYLGFGTVIINDGTVTLFNCHATLVSGTPVTATVVTRQNNCTFIFVPSGVVDVTCPRF